MTDKRELLPCPFARSWEEHRVELQDLGAGTGGYLVRCSCGAAMFGAPVDARKVNLKNKEEVHAACKAEAIAKWNRRAVQSS